MIKVSVLDLFGADPFLILTLRIQCNQRVARPSWSLQSMMGCKEITIPAILLVQFQSHICIYIKIYIIYVYIYTHIFIYIYIYIYMDTYSVYTNILYIYTRLYLLYLEVEERKFWRELEMLKKSSSTPSFFL